MHFGLLDRHMELFMRVIRLGLYVFLTFCWQHLATAGVVVEEVISLTTDDGVRLPAILMYPSEGMDVHSPAIVHIHGGPGGSPISADSAARYVAEELAGAGYTNLSVESRHASRYPFTLFDEVVIDVQAAVDMLAARGFSDIVLAGAGLGSLRVARYLVETDDSRVKAVLHFSPTQNMADNWRERVGEVVYWETIDRAAKAISEGGRRKFIDLGDGLIFTPNSFLDWFGPTSKTSLSANIAGIDKPMFMAAGEDDPLVPRGRLEELKSIAFISPRVNTKSYPGAGRLFEGARQRLANDTIEWLSDIGLAVKPRVKTTLVNVVAGDGTSFTGVLYTPASNPDNDRPAFMLLHGWTGDVLRSSNHWLGIRLAQQGYVSVAIQHRSSGLRGVISGRLEDTRQDLEAWNNFMADRGHSNLVSVGHSAGGLWWTTYLAKNNDTLVKAAVYLAPNRDMPKHARKGMGEDMYARAVLEAQAAVREGKGASHLIDYPLPSPTYEEDPRQPSYLSPPGSGFTYYYADSFLSYWGPNSEAVHTQRISEINIPVLALGGSRDPYMQGGFLIEFTEAAGGPAEYIYYGGPRGATHSFGGFEDKITSDIISWINRVL